MRVAHSVAVKVLMKNHLSLSISLSHSAHQLITVASKWYDCTPMHAG